MEEGGLGNLGEMCQTDSECVEDLFCNGVPGFGGVCSECGSDADCPMGNCTFTGAYFGCGDGSEGQMCESDEVCGDGLFCAEVVNLGGLFNGNFCSECKVDADCPEGQLCAPQIEFMDLMNIAGQRACIDPESAPDGQLCDADGSGDEQCSGFCTTADIMGLLEVGVCGECETDADCAMGTCMPAMVGLDGFAGSTCG
jgi:Cys-rich repeat protein